MSSVSITGTTALLRLGIGWWNVGLSPLGKPSERYAERVEIASEVLRELILAEGVDLLGLGEVTEDDLTKLVPPELLNGQFELVVPRRQPHPQKRLSPAVLYNRAKIQLLEKKTRDTGRIGKFKLNSLDLTFAVEGLDEPLCVMVAHWPSRRERGGVEWRNTMAQNLGEAIRDLAREAERPPHVVVLGDFNDEPFDPSMAEYLEASRDRTLVRRQRFLLYNPFWRLLGERQPLERECEGRIGAGTYYYRSGGANRWYTFDQILFSCCFLDPEGCSLQEKEVRIWQKPPLLGNEGRPVRGFDHFPVTAAVGAKLRTSIQE